MHCCGSARSIYLLFTPAACPSLAKTEYLAVLPACSEICLPRWTDWGRTAEIPVLLNARQQQELPAYPTILSHVGSGAEPAFVVEKHHNNNAKYFSDRSK